MDRQQELFSEFQDRESRKKLFSKGFLPDRAVTVILTYEKLIFAALGVGVILLIIFAVGFECGKRVLVTPKPAAVFVRTQPVAAKKEVQVPRPETPKSAPKPYMIQVASFKSKQYAQEESAKLRSKGFSAAIILVNGIYEVLAGEYADMKEASQALNTLNKIYKGCIIRKR